MMPIFYICSLLLFPTCFALYSYQSQIPNGGNVAHPCLAGTTWPGVGHQNKNGGGTRNPFGLAFAAAGHQWTTDLCKADTDGDGKTNGEELGDPTCVWSYGKTPSRVANITHPGVCEPVNSPKCQGKNDFLTCTVDGFGQCDIIKGSDVRTVNLTFPYLSVPAADTTYLCMSFDLPSDQDYHIIADQPIINNSNVVHHMILYGCEDPNASYIPSPKDCEMSNTDCSSIIASWAVGETGSCMDETYGFRIGATSFKRVVLETHYNNPKLVSTYKDSSGIRLYIRPARQGVKDLFTFLTGQILLELPPGQSSIEKVGVCKGSCTSMLIKEPIYVISAANHMHYYGRSMKIQLYRNGALISTLANDEEYDLDSPVDHEHDPPVQILPGDEIITTCTYDTSSATEWVYYGESTSDEMCFGYLTAYPKQALKTNRSSCESVSTMSYCEMQQGTPLNGCDWNTLLKPDGAAYQKLESVFSDNCQSDTACGSGCTAVLKNISSNPCFQGETAKILKGLLKCSEGSDLVNQLQSCPSQSDHVLDLCDVSYGTWIGSSGVTTTATTKPPVVTTKPPVVTTRVTTRAPVATTKKSTAPLELRCQPESSRSSRLSCRNLVQSRQSVSLSCQVTSDLRRTISLRCRNLLVSRPLVSVTCQKLSESRRSLSISCPNIL